MPTVKWMDDTGDVYEFRYDAERNLEVFMRLCVGKTLAGCWLPVEEIDMVDEMEIRRRLDAVAE